MAAASGSGFLMQTHTIRPICFAPMEGLTDHLYRQAHHACFQGVSRYFIPFISPTEHRVFTPREFASVSPKNNEGLNAVPQILCKNPDYFVWAAGALQDLGYEEVNLNIGCPSGTVTAKGKGSGMLRSPDTLALFLDEIFARSPIPVSIKTRIGFESPEEWPALLSVLSRYPAKEIIIHPRTRRQFYAGETYRETLDAAFEMLRCPIVLNGDLFTPEEMTAMVERYPQTSGLMLGRGLVANPALAQEWLGGEKLTHESLRHFHDVLYDSYAAQGPGDLALRRLRMMMSWTSTCFEEPAKPLKAIQKSRTNEGYRDAAQRLFDEHALVEKPYYSLCP